MSQDEIRVIVGIALIVSAYSFRLHLNIPVLLMFAMFVSYALLFLLTPVLSSILFAIVGSWSEAMKLSGEWLHNPHAIFWFALSTFCFMSLRENYQLKLQQEKGEAGFWYPGILGGGE